MAPRASGRVPVWCRPGRTAGTARTTGHVGAGDSAEDDDSEGGDPAPDGLTVAAPCVAGLFGGEAAWPQPVASAAVPSSTKQLIVRAKPRLMRRIVGRAAEPRRHRRPLPNPACPSRRVTRPGSAE